MVAKKATITIVFIGISVIHTLLAQDKSQELVFPIVVSGFLGDTGQSPRFETTFSILNQSNASVPARIQLYTNQGKEVDGGLYAFTIPPNLLFPFSLFYAAITAGPIPPQVNGWGRLTLQSDASVVAQSEITFFPDPRSIYIPSSSAYTPTVKPTKMSQISFVYRPGRRSAVAIVNPSSSQNATVEIRVERPYAVFGFGNCPIVLTLSPRQRLSKFLDELCGAVTGGSLPPEGALVTITSDVPVSVGAIDVFPQGGFTSLPVRAIPDN